MIIFTQHALLKLKQRNILKKLVTEVFKNPDYILESYSDRKIIYKKFSRLYLKVIYREESENIVVITQYWTKTIK
jgi:hypothetical protein